MATEHETPAAPIGPRAHDIGRKGAVTIVVEADDVRVRGVDGTEARVVAPADGVGIETTAEAGRFTVRTARNLGLEKGGFVGLRIGSRGFGVPLRLRISGTVEVEVPRDARVTVTSGGGDVAIRDVQGGVAARTASGDISVKRTAGAVTAEAASGDVHVAASEPISLEARTVSGDVRVRAPRFDRVAVETVSGDAELAGRFAPEGAHAISTISGDVELALVGGLTVETKTVSGDVRCDHPDRRSGDGRGRPLVIGDGAARLAVRTMSGSVEVRAGKPAGEAARTASDTATATGGIPVPDFPAPPAPPRPPAPPVAPSPSAQTATAPAATGTAGASEGTLDILEALARGDIDVAEAERRLASGGTPGEPAREGDRDG